MPAVLFMAGGAKHNRLALIHAELRWENFHAVMVGLFYEIPAQETCFVEFARRAETAIVTQAVLVIVFAQGA